MKPEQEVVSKPYQAASAGNAAQQGGAAQAQGPVANKSQTPKGPVAPQKQETPETDAAK